MIKKKEYVSEHQSYASEDKNLCEILKLKKNRKVLSMGCGAGREVKMLKAMGMKITAVDIDADMINSSKKMEPRANYKKEDIIQFLEREREREKYDYVLGLYNFLCGISRPKRQFLIDKSFELLTKRGIILLRVKWVKLEARDNLKMLLAFMYCLLKGIRWEYGDVLVRDFEGKPQLTHYFTRRQIEKLLSGKNYEIEESTIRVYKN